MNNTARFAAGITALISGSALLLAPLTASAQPNTEATTTRATTAAAIASDKVDVNAEVRCEHVTGEFVFSSLVFTSPTTAVGEGTATGDFAGTFHADYSNIRQPPGGPIKMDATHAITTPEGLLVTSDEILLIPQDEPGVVQANSRLHIVGETGQFEGATGRLHTSGTVNLDTLEGAIGFKGRICFA
jgi:hypothetical protein